MTALSPAQQRYVRTESLINSVINTAISAFFVWVAFRGMSVIPLWGERGLVMDLVPTCIAITVFSCMILTLSTRVRLKRGKVSGLDERRGPAGWLPRNVILRTVVAALVVTAIAVPLTTLGLVLVDADGASYNNVLVFKIIYGFVLSMLISPPLLWRALADQPSVRA